MCDALADRSNEADMMPPMGPKNRLPREHELHDDEEYDEEVEDLVAQAEQQDNIVQSLDYISQARLVEITGESDLTRVTFFQAQVDTENTSLSDLGNVLPALEQLKLSHSNICSLRDLGTSLRTLRVLWLNRSGLLSLDGLGSINETIEELYIAFNHITDLSPIADDEFEKLRVLDADSNEIEDPEQIEFLGGCKALQQLTLENNPVASKPGYVVVVRQTLSGLELLDDVPIDSDHREIGEDIGEDGQLSEVMVVAESIKLSRLGYEDVEYLCGANPESKVPSTARPSTSGARPGSSRPATSGGLRPKTPFESCITGFGTAGRPSTSLGTAPMRPGTGARPSTSSGLNMQPEVLAGSSSDLTFGSNEALCGGISRALRSRKRDVRVQQSSPIAEQEEESLSALLGKLPEGSSGEADIMTINFDDPSDEDGN